MLMLCLKIPHALNNVFEFQIVACKIFIVWVSAYPFLVPSFVYSTISNEYYFHWRTESPMFRKPIHTVLCALCKHNFAQVYLIVAITRYRAHDYLFFSLVFPHLSSSSSFYVLVYFIGTRTLSAIDKNLRRDVQVLICMSAFFTLNI